MFEAKVTCRNSLCSIESYQWRMYQNWALYSTKKSKGTVAPGWIHLLNIPSDTVKFRLVQIVVGNLWRLTVGECVLIVPLEVVHWSKWSVHGTKNKASQLPWMAFSLAWLSHACAAREACLEIPSRWESNTHTHFGLENSLAVKLTAEALEATFWLQIRTNVLPKRMLISTCIEKLQAARSAEIWIDGLCSVDLTMRRWLSNVVVFFCSQVCRGQLYINPSKIKWMQCFHRNPSGTKPMPC